MEPMFTPIDVQSITRNALQGSGPEEGLRPRRPVSRRYRWLRRQPTERPVPAPAAPAARRSRTSGRSVPST